MQITLIHNPSAGDEKPSARKLMELLRDAGHEVRHRSTRAVWKKALRKEADLVVAAGGDGTVRKVALELASLGNDAPPFTILPCGTANNIAKTLGIRGPADEIIQQWPGATPRPLDLGTLSSKNDDQEFVEAFGGGIIAELISRKDRVNDMTQVMGRRLDRDRIVLREILKSGTAASWEVEVDGADHSSRYVAVEILNMPISGPNVPLAPGASPHDGKLAVLLMGPDEAQQLVSYLDQYLESAEGVLGPMPVLAASEVRVRPPRSTRLRLDDKLWENGSKKNGKSDLTIGLHRGALQVLAG